MRIAPGSYVEIKYELSYMEGDEIKIIATTKRVAKKLEVDEKTGEAKPVEVTIDKPTIIKLGSGELPRFFEDHLLNVEVELGKIQEIEFPPEKAYGERDPKKIVTMPIKKFRERIDRQELFLESGGRKPRSGENVYMNIGGTPIFYGRIIRATERAVIIDTNHPLSGKKIKATYTISRVVYPTDPKDEKMGMLIKKYFSDAHEYISFEVKDNILPFQILVAKSTSSYLK